MIAANSQIELLKSWCHEAVVEFGDDWPRIHSYIQSKLSALPEPERKNLSQSISLVLARPDHELH